MIQKTNPARPIAWFILLIGLIAAIIALLSQNQERVASFLVSQILIAGVVFIVVGVILLLLLRPIEIPAPQKQSAAPPPTPPRPTPQPVQQTPVVTPSPAPKAPDPAKPAEPDDLTLIEGIGPKSAQALYDAGVKTYAQVAQMAPEELYRIVKVEANVQIVGKATTTWPKQAQYLVRGDMDGLKSYQDYLISGKDTASYKTDPNAD